MMPLAHNGTSHTRLRVWVTRLVKAAMLLAILLAAAGVLAWLTGRVVSDRYYWSQWLLWVPTLAVIPVAVAGLALTVVWPRKRTLLAGWLACVIGLLVYFCFIEYRMFAKPPTESQGLRIVHWNATQDGGSDDQYIDALIAGDGDITITTDAWAIPFRPRVYVWNEGTPPSMRPFAVLTKLPILRLRYLVNEDEIIVVLLEVDATERIGRPLVMYLVDMPSDLTLARAELARQARRMIDNAAAPPPDLVIGDFNITRGSAAMRIMFPGLTHAYDQAGHGYSATFHRGEGGWLLYHIDHALLSDTVRATDYEIIETGVGRHRMQAVTIVPR